MLFSFSLRSMFRRRARVVLALGGIAVSAALLLDMTMMATGLTRSFEELIGARGYTMRVAPRGTLPFDSEAGIRESARVAMEIAAVEGVRDVSAVLGAQMYLVQDDELEEPIFTSGVVAESQFLYELVNGRDAEAGEVVVGRPLAEALALGVGDTIRLAAEMEMSLGGPRAVRGYGVSGVADFLYDSAGQRSLAMPLPELQRLTRRPDQVSLMAVAVGESADEDEVAAAIQLRLPEVSVYSTRVMMAEMNRRLLYFRQLATILGSVALVVTGLLISTIITIGVRERFGEIATLRVIGVQRRRILLAIGLEGLALGTLGCALGLPLGLVVSRWLDAILLSFPGIPANVSFFVWDFERVAIAIALVIGVGAFAGLLPGWSAVTAPLGSALRQEAE